MDYFQGFTSIEILRHVQKNLNARQINPDQFEGRIKFMSKTKDIDWTQSGNSDVREVSDHAKEFQPGHWSFPGPRDEEKWYGTCNYEPEVKWDQQANQMIEVFVHRGHPVFRGISALCRRTLLRK